MKKFFACVLLLALSAFVSNTKAQETLGIAAVVNDEIISIYDLNMRLSLVINFSGLPQNNETRQRLAPQVLRTLIDDELKRQEAARLKIPITESEIENTFRNMEKRNGQKVGALKDLLARRGITIATLSNKIEADIAWQKLINSRFGAGIQISEEEIDEILADIKNNAGKPEYRVLEIFLPIDNQKRDQEILSLGHRLIQQAKSASSFRALARNFSKSPTAEKGGDLGWNRIGQLGGKLDNVLAGLQPGQISIPTRTEEGYYILFLQEKRIAKGLSGSEENSPLVNIQQFFLQLPKDASPAQVADSMEAAKILGKRVKSCQDMEKFGKDFKAPLSGNLGDIKTSALAPQQRNLIRGLPILKASPPLRTADGVVVLMVCKRTETKKPDLGETALRERIANKLINERLGLSARQHLRDLRRAAFVDIRL
ncbi:MAG: peptidylprolyl isomerase [Rhodospirillales bacterium]|nr:peptidylprolyl isomerase [Rhodospirillales bacterium]